MAIPLLPPDFKDFLKLLAAHKAEYLIVGGYAVGYYGYPRATGDLDIWVASDLDNARKLAAVIREFGFTGEQVTPELFRQPGQIIRMGVPPVRIEVITSASGVTFTDCYPRRTVADLDGTSVTIIAVPDLKKNKQACGRHQDLADLEHLP